MVQRQRGLRAMVEISVYAYHIPVYWVCVLDAHLCYTWHLAPSLRKAKATPQRCQGTNSQPSKGGQKLHKPHAGVQSTFRPAPKALPTSSPERCSSLAQLSRVMNSDETPWAHAEPGGRLPGQAGGARHPPAAAVPTADPNEPEPCEKQR